MTVQCCVCYRIKDKERWINKGYKKLIPASHGYCDICYAKVRKAMLKEILKRGLNPLEATNR